MPETDEVMRRLAGAQHGLAARSQLAAAGVPSSAVRRRLAQGTWRALSPRVVGLAGAAASGEGRALAAVLDGGPGTVASHATAAWLWGLPGFDGAEVHVSRSRPARSRGAGVLGVVHHPASLHPAHCTAVRAVPVTTLVRTVFDVAAMVHLERAERVLQAALRRGLAWPAVAAHLAETARRGRGGTVAMRALLDRHGGRPPLGSGLELEVLRLLEDGGLPEPRRQVDLGGGAWAARVDFLYDDVGLVVEVNGAWSHTSPLDVERDQRRTARLVAAGYAVLPITEAQVRDRPAEVVLLVREARARTRRSRHAMAPDSSAIA